MREAVLVRRILEYLNRQPQTRARKLHGGLYSSGWPDILCVQAGRVFFLEVKRPGQQATRLQDQELTAWRQVGAYATVVRGLQDVREMGL